MENSVVKLYGDSDVPRLRRKAIVLAAAAAAAGALCLSACVIMAVSAYKTESMALLPWVFAVSAAGGWTVISILHFPLADTRAAIKHTEAVLKAEKERVTESVEGEFGFSGQKLYVKKGIVMYGVTEKLSGKTLQIYSKKRKHFPAEKVRRVETAFGFITGYEE